MHFSCDSQLQNTLKLPRREKPQRNDVAKHRHLILELLKHEVAVEGLVEGGQVQLDREGVACSLSTRYTAGLCSIQTLAEVVAGLELLVHVFLARRLFFFVGDQSRWCSDRSIGKERHRPLDDVVERAALTCLINGFSKVVDSDCVVVSDVVEV